MGPDQDGYNNQIAIRPKGRHGVEVEYEDPIEAEPETVDMLYLVSRLEDLVGYGKRVPFSGRVMVGEAEFLDLVEQMRATVPEEIRAAERVLQQRESIIASAQSEAEHLLVTAKEQAQYFVSKEGIVNEANQVAEKILRDAEERKRRDIGEIDAYAFAQFERVEDAMREGLELIDRSIRETVITIGRAKNAIANPEDDLSPFDEPK